MVEKLGQIVTRPADFDIAVGRAWVGGAERKRHSTGARIREHHRPHRLSERTVNR